MDRNFDVATAQRPFYIGQRTLSNQVIDSDIYVKPHVHNGLEIGVAISGRGHLYLDGSLLTLDANDLYFTECSIPHCVGTFPDESFDFLYVHLSTEALGTLLPLHYGLVLVQFFRYGRSEGVSLARQQARAVRSLRKAYDLYQTENVYDYIQAWTELVQGIVSIAAHLFPCGVPSYRSEKNVHSGAVLDALQFIHENFREPLTVKDMAQRCALSPSHFAHQFSTEIGSTPIEYRNKLRIDFCLERLISSDDKIEKIAFDSGFENLSHFFRQFKRAIGATPAQVRKGKEIGTSLPM